MFLSGFTKTAATLVTMSPEEYYEIVRQKDPFVGATLGAVLGGAAGGLRGKRSAKTALIGAGAGAGAGAASGYLVGKGVRKYQAARVRRMADELNLKSSPARKHGG